MNHGRFTECHFLRSIGRGLLTEFFTRFQVAVPAADVADDVFFAGLSKLLLSPEGLPDAVNEVLHEVQELSTEEGHQRLLEGVGQSGLQLSLGDKATPEELALWVWLNAPALLAQKVSEQRFSRLTAFAYFEKDEDGLSLASEAVKRRGDEGELVSLLDAWFARNGRGDETVLIERYDLRGEQFYLIRHGDTYLRSARIEKRKVEVLHYRPAKDDLVVYTPERDELRINAKTKGERDLYAAAFGAYLHGAEHYFKEMKTYSLNPLRELGEGALECDDIPGIKKVVLTHLELALGKDGKHRKSLEAEDVFAYSWDEGKQGLVIPADAKLQQASFTLFVGPAGKPVEVRIKPPNMIRLGKTGSLHCVHDWMSARGFKPRKGQRNVSR